MNKRLWELYAQSIIGIGESGSDVINIEQFAELIIQECMNLVKNCYAEPESGQSPYRTACASTIIEEHFGVEE